MPEKSLHIGIDATTWPNDRGFGRFTRGLLRALLARNSRLRYTLLFDQPPDESLPEGVEVICVATQSSLNESAVGTRSRSIAYLWKLGFAARRAKFDVFFFPAVYSYFPIPARVPCVVCYHDTTAERFPELLFPSKLNHGLWRVKTAMARLQTTRAMTVSRASARDVEDILRIPGERIDVVTEAADPAFRVIDDPEALMRARARYGIPAGKDLLVHVGGMNRHKNIMGLLEAMPEVVAKRPSTHLAIVGSVSGEGFWDNVPELQRFVESHPPLAEHVHFTGRIGDAELVELLNSAAALVFPSLWEGFGLPAVEAMSCGVPVLASNRGSLPEVVADAGLFFDPQSPLDIAGRVLHFLGDDDLRSQLEVAALERATTFDWSRAAELAEVCFRRCDEDARRH
jgi:glycosyltransferase involved in cell wall biosynthesis